MANSSSTTGFFVGFIVVALAVIGFAVVHHNAPSTVTVPAPQDDSAHLQNAIDINIYVDGSGSIKHLLDTRGSFAAKAGDHSPSMTNYLRDVLNKCESALSHAPGSGGWNPVNVRTWKFGSSITPLPSQGGLRDLSDEPDQFNEPHTYIQDPIKHDPQSPSANPRPELKIIITDLYQSGGEMEKPADVLASRYLNDETNAVGILAVRNPFFGGVEDLPGMANGQSIKDAADSMPFYIIFAGPAPDVRHAMDVVAQDTAIGDAFSQGLGLRLFFSRSPSPRVTETPRITGKYFNLIAKDYKGYKVSMIGLAKGIVMANWPDPAAVSEDGSLDLGTNYELQPSVTLLTGRGSQPGPSSAVAAVSTHCPEERPACVVVSRDGLQKGATYLYRFDRVGTVNPSVLAPHSDALKEWNIEKADAEKISLGGALFPPDQRFHGHPGKTPDLSKFLTALQGQMFHSPVRVTSYYLDVQAN